MLERPIEIGQDLRIEYDGERIVIRLMTTDVTSGGGLLVMIETGSPSKWNTKTCESSGEVRTVRKVPQQIF
jgi:hypothetical protein